MKSVETDSDGVELDFDLSDVKESAVRRMLRHIITRGLRRNKMAAKRDNVEIESEQDDDAEEMESEMEKNASLAMEKRGAPAGIPAKESDFRAGDVRRALKAMPKSVIKKARKS
jgi:hypothetical protein